jgi:hypothetical protein
MLTRDSPITITANPYPQIISKIVKAKEFGKQNTKMEGGDWYQYIEAERFGRDLLSVGPCGWSAW